MKVVEVAGCAIQVVGLPFQPCTSLGLLKCLRTTVRKSLAFRMPQSANAKFLNLVVLFLLFTAA